ncbi:MAG: prolyl aminopeptidase [Gammaproteobacteria bacterium]
MYTLYPDIRPYAVHSIKVDMPHVLFVEECGNKNGIPIVFLHGGPGAGCEPYHRRFFDPDQYRIILFDQRGCGRSTPHSSLKSNTTQRMAEDLEEVRRFLNIDKWAVFGDSWGATLGLVYAQAYPESVTAMILRGVFLGRPQDINWFYNSGASRFFPDLWQDFLKPLTENERENILESYYEKLTGPDELARMAAAKAWSGWEGRCATLRPSHTVIDHFLEPHTAMSLARIECHYFLNHAFLEPNQILDNMGRISDIPGTIVHGRYDMVCPLEQAYDLHQAWSNSELHIIRDAGHSASEPSIVDALVRATDDLAKHLDQLV